ncbi:hypothetical protein ACFPOI_52955 [Nonomuraea angiospora]|uniref:Spore-associated protein A n=1 Tax=Nonomuraea angiospora TaxID=46172 RepID=A0ABR9M6Z0_9ACTN|nr:hypothetical protein [Nonomuraea angiospora]MBE1588313.1 hypothetical protein [Nonomuraea angiospora]
MPIRRKIGAVVGVLVASTWLVASATPAAAAGPCGTGYSRIGVYNIPKSGTKQGTLEVYYNASSGKNCALAYGSGGNYGKKAYKAVGIATPSSNGWADYEDGDYAYYAGPVYASAKGKCIDLVGAVGSAIRYATNVHCG